MTTLKLSRRSLLAACAALALPGAARNAAAQGLSRIVYQTGWLPQPDKGGLYQALATGLYKEAGLDVELRSGGPQLNVNQIFLAGQCDFVDSDSTRALYFAQQGLPGVAVAAFGQKPLTAILSHPGTGADSLVALKGRPILVSTVGRQTYWPWLKSRFGFADDQARPYTYSMAPFLADRQVSMEGFITSEPYELHKAGVDAVVHVLAANGYEAYSNVMLTSPKLVATQPQVVQRFVDATTRGWASYLHGDPGPANALIQKGNPTLSADKLAYAHQAMQTHAIFDSADVKQGGLGAMSDAQWKRIADAMTSAGVIPAGVDVRKAYSLQFINKRVAG